MKRPLTDIICILDRSGSMGGLESDTIGGFNQFIKSQLKEEGSTRLTVILFDDQYEVLWDREDAATAKLTNKEYFVRGSTALLDAVGKTIHRVNRRLADSPASDHPDRVIVVITTDGYENSSREYTHAKVRDMVEYQKEQHDWQFVFLGANIDVEREAEQIGISREDAVRFEASTDGVQDMYCKLNSYISEKRKK